MTFQGLSEAEIAKILELARAGWSVPEIANEMHRSEGTILKYVRKGGLSPRWTPGSSTEVGIPEQVQTQETEKSEPEKVGVPQQPVRRHEGTTSLSKSADELSDMARIIGNTSFLRDAMSGRDPLDAIAKYGTLVRSETAPLEQAMAVRGQEMRELKAELASAQIASIQAHSQIAIEQLRGEIEKARLEMLNSLEKAKLEAQINAQDSWINRMKFVMDSSERYGVGAGELRREVQSFGHAFGVKIGGLVGPPETLPAPPPKVFSVRPSVPRTEKEFEEISHRLERIENEDSEHEQNRGARLQEIAIMRARIDELESAQSSSEPTKRELKVITPAAHQKKVIEVV